MHTSPLKFLNVLPTFISVKKKNKRKNDGAVIKGKNKGFFENQSESTVKPVKPAFRQAGFDYSKWRSFLVRGRSKKLIMKVREIGIVL